MPACLRLFEAGAAVVGFVVECRELVSGRGGSPAVSLAAAHRGPVAGSGGGGATL